MYPQPRSPPPRCTFPQLQRKGATKPSTGFRRSDGGTVEPGRCCLAQVWHHGAWVQRCFNGEHVVPCCSSVQLYHQDIVTFKDVYLSVFTLGEQWYYSELWVILRWYLPGTMVLLLSTSKHYVVKIMCELLLWLRNLMAHSYLHNGELDGINMLLLSTMWTWFVNCQWYKTDWYGLDGEQWIGKMIGN